MTIIYMEITNLFQKQQHQKTLKHKQQMKMQKLPKILKKTVKMLQTNLNLKKHLKNVAAIHAVRVKKPKRLKPWPTLPALMTNLLKKIA